MRKTKRKAVHKVIAPVKAVPKTRSRFLEFFERHRPASPFRNHIPPEGTRSRFDGPAARMQERGWAIARACQMPSTGQRVRAVRKLLGLTQQELASQSGVDQGAISRIERDLEALGVRRTEALARVFRIGPADLLWGLS